MNETLIEHAQHDIDRQNAADEKEGHALHRVFERLCRALETGLNRCRNANVEFDSFDLVHRIAKRYAWRQVERQRYSRELAEMIDRQGLRSAREMNHRKQW